MPRYPQVFHVGVPKSGTTTLQSVMGDDPRIHVIRSRHFNTSRYYVEPYPDGPADRVLIESDETLVKGDGVFSKPYITLARIREVAPDAHIILTIREQRALLVSGFNHNVKVGLPEGTLTEFLLSTRGTDFIAFAQYATLVELIGLYFAKDHVHVVPFEWLRSDPSRFFGSVYEVLGLELPDDLGHTHANPSPEPAQLEILARVGALRRAFLAWRLSRHPAAAAYSEAPPLVAEVESAALGYRMGGMMTLPRRAVRELRRIGLLGDRLSDGGLARAAGRRFAWGDDELCRALEAEFREQNRRLAAQTGIDLAALGYLV